jgi:hypothetical protein
MTDTAAYLAAVAAELADLPEDERADLLDDLDAHLAEVSAEVSSEGALPDLLGPPEKYAAELRAAAGLPVRRRGRPPWQAVRRAAERVTATRAYAEVRGFVPELRPAWWVARGYLLVVGLALLGERSLHDAVPLPRVGHSAFLGAAAVAAAVVASVRYGRRPPGNAGRALLAAVNVVAAVAAIGVLARADDTRSGVYYDAGYGPTGVLQGPYGTIDNIFVFDAEGHPLNDVRLYDSQGNSLADMICGDPCASRFGRSTGFPLPVFVTAPDGSVVEVHPPYAPPFPTPTPSATPSPAPTAKATPKPTPKATPKPKS